VTYTINPPASEIMIVSKKLRFFSGRIFR